MLTLSEAKKTGRLQEFIAQKQAAGVGPISEAKFDETASTVIKPPRHQPSKAELDEPIHLPGRSPEDVARIVMQGGAPRREPGDAES